MLLRARHVLPITSPPLLDGAVRVEDGRLTDVGPASDLRPRTDEEIVELGCTALLPGLVNAHSHLEISILRGHVGGRDLLSWIDSLIHLVKVFGEGDHQTSIRLGVLEALSSGITCVGDHGLSGEVPGVLSETGLRGVSYQEGFAFHPRDVAATLDRLSGELPYWRAEAGPLVTIGLTPHSPYTSHPDLWHGLGELAERENLPVSVHLAESPAEVAYLRDGGGPIGARRHVQGRPTWECERRPVEFLKDRGWLDQSFPLQLVHLTQANAAELALLTEAREEGRTLGLVACPRSNLRLGNGLPDLPGWSRLGLRWGLGTDGAPAVGSCDLFQELAHAETTFANETDRPAAATWLRRVTLDAAASLGLDDRIGSLEAGKEADLVALDLSGPHTTPAADPEAAVVFGARPSDVSWVMVGGKVLVDRREGGSGLATLDAPTLLAEAERRAEEIVDRAG